MITFFRTILVICIIPGGLARLQEIRKLEEPPEWTQNYRKPLPVVLPRESPAQKPNELYIRYEGNITRCDGSPDIGEVPFRSLEKTYKWNYWSLDLQEGHKLQINVTRTSCNMDPAFYVFSNTGVIVGAGDDELDKPRWCGFKSPFGDAQLNIQALPYTGRYVIGVFDNKGLLGDDEEEASYEIRVNSPDSDGNGIGDACDETPTSWHPDYLKPLPMAPPQESPAQETNETRIAFEGVITGCDGSPDVGEVPFRSLGDPNLWNYWSVDLQAGREVQINVTRISCGMDPAFYLFFNTGVIVGSGDDELEPPESCGGEDAPFRDAQLNIRALPFTGQYVVGVFDNAGVPEDEEEEAAYEIRIFSPDVDGDGVGEACDRCPFTKLDTTVKIQDCDSGVSDVTVTEDGCSIGDLLPGVLKKCDKRTRMRVAEGEDYSFTGCVQGRQRKLRKAPTARSYSKKSQKSIMKCVRQVDREKISALCGNRFYASDKNNLFIVDPHTGQSQFVGRLPTCSAEIIYDEGKNIVLNEKCGGSVISQVNASDASLVQFEPPHIRGPISGLEFVENSGLFGTWVKRKTNPRNSFLALQDSIKSTFKVIGPTGMESLPGLTYDLGSGDLFGVSGGNSHSELVTLDMESGRATFIANVTSQEPTRVNNFGSTDIGPDGDLFGGINENGETWPSSLIKINKRTGEAKLIGESNVGYRGLTCYCL